MKVKKIYVRAIMSDEEADKTSGMLLTVDHCKKPIREDVDVYDKETGKCIAKFRRKQIPADLQLQAFNALQQAAKPSLNRGTATKRFEGVAGFKKIRSNGKISKTSEALTTVDSGIIGYFDRNARFPYCRQTAFNQHEFAKFKKAYPVIKLVDKLYSELMPEEYARQRAIADRTSQDFVIKGTAFTTVTVNKNWQTAVHKDAGDFTGGFGNLVALRKGTFSGGYFVLVKWGVGFDLQNGDILLVDVHQWHGNTPIIKDDPKAVRLSLVMYYREKMHECGTMAQELKRVQNRKRGDKLHGK